MTTNNRLECQPNIIGVVSPESGVASINVSLGDVIQRLKLPIGIYDYELFYKGSNCSVNVYIKGKNHNEETQQTITEAVNCLFENRLRNSQTQSFHIRREMV